MKKKTVVTVFVSVLLLSSILGARLTMPVNAPTLHDVYPGESIQEAINSAQLGDTIFVHEGTYSQQVFVNKSLTLIGEDASTTIIEGVHASKVGLVKISGFTIRRSIHGINLTDCDSVTISGNIVTDNIGYGIFLLNSRNIVISDNTVLGNGARGVYLRYSSHNTVSNNTVSMHSQYGIFLFHSDNNVISRNTAMHAGAYGIYLSSSSNNGVFGNTITNNDLGVESLQCYKNTISHNNFINNAIQVTELISSNVWDNGYPSGGNYWSDYDGTDIYSGVYQNQTGSDGVGDNPYIVSGNKTDHYPLVGKFSDFPVTCKEETYHITTVCNSTISAFQFDQANKTIGFNVTGEEGIGFCRVCIPHDLMLPPHTVIIDNGQTPVLFYNYSIYDNGTHRWIYFAYGHPTHEVIIQGPPTISILSPENKTYSVNQVPLTFTVSKPTSWIGYCLDGQTNATITENTTLSELSNGSHSLIIYAKDTAGNTGASEIIYFSIKIQQAEPFPTLIVATIAIVAVVGAGLMVYFAKVKKTTKTNIHRHR